MHRPDRLVLRNYAAYLNSNEEVAYYSFDDSSGDFVTDESKQTGNNAVKENCQLEAALFIPLPEELDQPKEGSLDNQAATEGAEEAKRG